MSTWSQVRVRSRVASRARILASIALQGSIRCDQCTGQALRIPHPTQQDAQLGLEYSISLGKCLMLLPTWDKDQVHCCAAPGMMCYFACGKRLCLHLHLMDALLCLGLLSLLIFKVRGVLQHTTPALASHLTSAGAEAGRLHSKKKLPPCSFHTQSCNST